MHTYIYIYTYICVHKYLFIYIYIYIFIYTCVKRIYLPLTHESVAQVHVLPNSASCFAVGENARAQSRTRERERERITERTHTRARHGDKSGGEQRH